MGKIMRIQRKILLKKVEHIKHIKLEEQLANTAVS